MNYKNEMIRPVVENERISKRAAILNSTLFLVSVYGFHGTSMAMIAENASIGAGTIYRYFKNKDELIMSLMQDIQHKVVDAMLADYDENVPYRERFERMWLNMTRYYMEH
ncbi:MAG: TetR/AcrR family transcriptional regulator, partial [Flavobacteriales bacterium]|nr:TetR/AcrR family transcriptional regulator [Flavobacteriales bacterium]